MAETALETPRPLPHTWAGIATHITGRTQTRFTTGPATARALSRAGAHGATTGSVIHLARLPQPHAVGAEVVAHELGHSRTPVLRPRFLLAGGHRHDAEEHAARDVVQRAVVQRPVVQRATPLSGDTAAALGAATDRYLPGLVGSLPVTSAGAVLEAARELTRPTALVGLPGGSGAGTTAGASTAPAVAAGLGSDAVPPPTGLQPGAGGSGTPAGGPAAGGATARPPSPPGGAVAAAGHPLDLDRLLEALEDHVLRELERRGGRFEGVF